MHVCDPHLPDLIMQTQPQAAARRTAPGVGAGPKRVAVLGADAGSSVSEPRLLGPPGGQARLVRAADFTSLRASDGLLSVFVN